jgi:hypothetical protein
MSGKQSNVDLRRRRFVQAASGALAASFIPTAAEAAEAATTNAVKKKIVADVRQQLKATTKMKPAQIDAVIVRVKDVLPQIASVSFGQLVIGVRVDQYGNPTGLSGCDDGHSCAGRFDEAPPDPTCTEQGTVCHAEACSEQSCDDHWCESNACDVEACDNNLCEEQGCDTEACAGHECTANTDTEVIAMMSKTKGWSKVQAKIDELKKAEKLQVKVVVQQP